VGGTKVLRLDGRFALGMPRRSSHSRVGAIQWARSVAGSTATVYLDTETTGIHASAEIVDIAVVDGTGTALLNTLVRPQGPIPVTATAIHNIGDAAVADAPTWSEIHGVLQELLCDRTVVVYNAEFDARMVSGCSERIGHRFPTSSWQCAMRGYAAFQGRPGRYPGEYRLHKLDVAVAHFGGKPGAHRALSDAAACRLVVLGMASAPAINDPEDRGGS
jgi:DNA polymerase-3 subunit epsilon